MVRILFSLIIIYLSPALLSAEVLFTEDFETDSNLSGQENIVSATNFDSGQDGDGSLAVHDTYAHSGSRSLRAQLSTGAWTGLWDTTSYGDDFYLQMWIRIDSASSTSNNNKLVYFLNSAGNQANNTCFKTAYGRYPNQSTGNCAYDWTSSSGYSFHYLGPGCATPPVTLYSDAVKLLPVDTWCRVVVHYSYDSGTDTLTLECWIDNDGNGLVKTGENTVSSGECEPDETIGGMGIGYMAGANYLYINYDDIIVGTTAADVGIGAPGETPTTISVGGSGSISFGGAN